MADIELVIKIEEETYNRIMNGWMPLHKAVNLMENVQKGTPLPKGHGRLKDADELHSIFKKNCDAYGIDNLSFMSDMDMNFDLAPTIIEADKENNT